MKYQTLTVVLLTGLLIVPVSAVAQTTLELESSTRTEGEHDQGVTIVEVSADANTQTSVGTEREDIGAPAAEAKGNVEATWKVEEGQKSPEPDDEVLVVFEHGGAGDEPGGETRMNKAELIAELEAQAAVFVKLGDIKGESQETVKKPKEIVVVGSKVRAATTPKIQLATTGGTARPDSFFDITFIVNDEDAALHAAAVVQGDESVKEAVLTDTQVAVAYQTTVRLFGFIPVRATQTVTVDNADAEHTHSRVKVKMPWWSAFGSKVVRPHDLEAAVEAELDAQYNESDLTFLQERAQTLQTISNVSKMLHDTAMAVIRKID